MFQRHVFFELCLPEILEVYSYGPSSNHTDHMSVAKMSICNLHLSLYFFSNCVQDVLYFGGRTVKLDRKLTNFSAHRICYLFKRS